MTETEVDVAKHEIAIYEKELHDAVKAHDGFAANTSKEMEGKNVTEKYAIALASLSQKQIFYDRVLELMAKLVKAYKSYVNLLEQRLEKLAENDQSG